ncbi:MAG TPA: hypothetical protein VGL86_13570 [Polyangia bacterium]|jgi:tetratricopeptide (TPR) repeat protein
MRWWGIVAALLVLGGVASADDADVRRQAREHFQKGTTAYELGHFDVAVTEYEAAYSLVNEPSLLFNLGQAHRAAGHSETALRMFRMYLMKVPDTTHRAEVEAKIAALTSAIEQEHKEHPATAPVPVETPPTAPPPTAPAETTTTTTAPTPAPMTPTPSVSAPADVTAPAGHARTFKIAGIVTAAAGVGLVAAGIACGVLAKNAADSISSADANHQPYDPSKYSTYHNDLIASGVLIGVGAAAAVTGTVLAIIGVRRGHAAMALQVTPQLSPAHAGLSATVRF